MQRNPEQTRERILRAAFDEMYRLGYQGMRVDEVLSRTELKKGALYHHFPGKQALGYAVVDEIIRDYVQRWWLEPLRGFDDPIEGLMQTLWRVGSEHGAELVRNGCPLNNIAQEMSPVDEGFRLRAQVILDEWMAGIASALERGQANGTVAPDVDCRESGRFILAAMEGCVGLAKNRQSADALNRCGAQLVRYLKTLRP